MQVEKPTDEEEVIKLEKPQLVMHLRPLYVKAYIDGRIISQVLIDDGAIMNVVLVGTLRKLGKTQKDLKETNMKTTNFTGESTEALGFCIAELKMGAKTSSTMFFVVNAKPGYYLLLGRDWIYSNMCVPSTLHQQLMFWNGGKVKVISADQKPFSADVKVVEAMYYTPNFQPIIWPPKVP